MVLGVGVALLERLFLVNVAINVVGVWRSVQFWVSGLSTPAT